MAKKMQGKFTAEFKAQVSLASKHHWCSDPISNQMTVSEIVEKYNVSKTVVYQWKDEFLAD
jgi:transposase-like protein